MITILELFGTRRGESLHPNKKYKMKEEKS